MREKFSAFPRCGHESLEKSTAALLPGEGNNSMQRYLGRDRRDKHKEKKKIWSRRSHIFEEIRMIVSPQANRNESVIAAKYARDRKVCFPLSFTGRVRVCVCIYTYICIRSRERAMSPFLYKYIRHIRD